MAFILRSHNIRHRIDPSQANMYVAQQIRMYQYMRNPEDIDQMVTHGYHVLMDAIHLYSDIHDFFDFIRPANAVENDRGYSFYEQKKFEGKSQALIDFFKEDKPDF